MKKIFASLFLMMITVPVFAIDLLPHESPGFFGQKVRNLGMGNVGISVLGTVDSSAFYNAAGLNDLTKEDREIRFMTITASVSQNAFGLINDVKDLHDNIDAADTDADEVRVLNDFINERTGEFQHTSFGIELISYTRENLAMGLLFDEKMDLSFRDQSFPHFDMRSLGDAGGYIAFSTGFWGKVFQMGMTFKPVLRFALNEEDQEITYADVTTENSKGDPILLDQFKNIYDNRQFAVPVDIGFKSNLAIGGLKDSFFITQLKPQIGVTWEDIATPSFAPLTSQTQSVNAGMSINPQFGRIKTLLAAEFREINWDRPLISKLHVGTEVKFPIVLALRAGLNEGYITGGATFDLWIFKLDAAVYYEEIGFHTQEAGNLRYATTFGFKI